MSKNFPASERGQRLLPEQTKGKKIRDYEDEELDDFKNKMNNRVLELFVKNIEQDQKLRNKYAMILIIILSIELIVLMTIFILKGCKVLDYSDTTLNIFVSGGIAEVFLLVRVIVKYLFKDNLTEAFKIILRSNNKEYINNKKFNKYKKSDKP